MSEVSSMQVWLQGCLDAYGSGKVNLETCDGVPGNWTLHYLGTEEVKRSSDLRGAMLVRYRCHYQLRYISVGPGAGALRAMQEDMGRICGRGEGPRLSDLPGSTVTAGGARRLKANPDGTAEYAMEIYGEYDQYYPGE